MTATGDYDNCPDLRPSIHITPLVQPVLCNVHSLGPGRVLRKDKRHHPTNANRERESESSHIEVDEFHFTHNELIQPSKVNYPCTAQAMNMFTEKK
jgi:hypothetical protein